MLSYITRGDAVVYIANPGLYGVMEVSRVAGDFIHCLVDGQVFGERFTRAELRLASAEEKRRKGEVGGARACDGEAVA